MAMALNPRNGCGAGCADAWRTITRNGEFGLWAVVEKSTRDVIGYCGLSRFEDVGGQPETEVGYRLIRSAWGHGYATEAATAVRDYAFDTLSLTRLIAIIDPRNVASIRVAEKI